MTNYSDKLKAILYHPIGIIHSPYKHSKGTPIQTISGSGISSTLEIYPEYFEGLKDIEGFSHLILIYHMHLIKKAQLSVLPFLDIEAHGVFATRSPARPNPIGISVVKLERAEGCFLFIKDTDMLDGTPILDLKPYIPVFDVRNTDRTGWFKNNINKISNAKDDGRFC